MEAIREWLQDNDWVMWALGAFTVVSLVSAVLVVPWAVARMAPDYFLPDRDVRRSFANLHPVLRWVGLILKNILGWFVVVFGVILLALPGQGLLTLLAGLVLINFPGKRALELWIIRFPLVLRAVNWLRARRDREPLQVPPRQ